MELTFTQQTTAFFLSIPLGVLLAVFYGVLKFCRYALSLGKAATVVLDVVFMLVWAMSAFFFSLGYLMGYIRLYVFLGSFLGFLLYRLTLGRLFFHIYRPVLRFLKVIFHKIGVKSKKFAKYLLKIAGKLLYNVSREKECFKQKRKSRHELKIKQRKSNELEKTKNQKGGRRAKSGRGGSGGSKGNRKA